MIVKDNPYFNATVTRLFGLKNPIHRSVASIDEQLYKNTGKVHIYWADMHILKNLTI